MYLPVPSQPDCVSAWREAVRVVDGAPGHQAYNVIIDVADPSARATLADPVVAEVDAFLAGRGKKPIETVANTIFPAALYHRHGAPLFFDRFRDNVLPKVRLKEAWSGYYFERMMQLPQLDGPPINQIWGIVERLRNPKVRALNKFELSVFDPARDVERALSSVAQAFGLRTRVMRGPGAEPIGRGIGPALEAQDILAVLQGQPGAEDLAHRACELAGGLLELADAAPAGEGYARARACLESGGAWAKFQRICEAQGGMRAPPVARFQQDMIAPYSGRLVSIDNRKLATVAKLAGAPVAKAAGVALQCRLNQMVDAGAPLCSIHAESPGELDYAAAYAVSDGPIFGIEAL